MKKNFKIKGPPGFEPGTSRSTIESLLIKKCKQVILSLFYYHMLASVWYTDYRLKWVMSGIATIRSMRVPLTELSAVKH